MAPTTLQVLFLLLLLKIKKRIGERERESLYPMGACFRGRKYQQSWCKIAELFVSINVYMSPDTNMEVRDRERKKKKKMGRKKIFFFYIFLSLSRSSWTIRISMSPFWGSLLLRCVSDIDHHLFSSLLLTGYFSFCILLSCSCSCYCWCCFSYSDWHLSCP